MKHVGQMFYQVDPHNTGEVPGAGFGLWLVREVARCHGGEVKLSSPTNDDGTGTLVELILPGATQEVVRTEALGAATVNWPAAGS
jgi:signal transduction histidine kinase